MTIDMDCIVALALLAAPPLEAREYLKQERAQSRGFTPGVVTEGGKIVWVSGQTGLVDENGKSMAGDFEGQARVIFRNIDAVVKRAGGSLKDVVTITVYLTDPRLIDPLMPDSQGVLPRGQFPRQHDHHRAQPAGRRHDAGNLRHRGDRRQITSATKCKRRRRPGPAALQRALAADG